MITDSVSNERITEGKKMVELVERKKNVIQNICHSSLTMSAPYSTFDSITIPL
jgi:hypothetical protein